MKASTETRLPQENPKPLTLADAEVGFLWTCLDSNGESCAAMRNSFGEVIRVNKAASADWFKSVRPPRDFRLCRPIQSMRVDFSAVHD